MSQRIAEKTKKSIIALLARLDSIDRTRFVYNLFTSDLSDDHIGESSTKVTRFKDLCIGDKFIAMPMPGSDSGYIFKKVQVAPNKLYLSDERDNATSLIDGVIRTCPPDMLVLKVI